MSYKLSEQLETDAKSAFDFYRKYIELNKHRLPESVIEVINDENWNGGSIQKSPMDSDLKQIIINSENKSIELYLQKRRLKANIKLTYLNVFYHNLDFNLNETLTWRYEQFKCLDIYKKYNKNGTAFTHEIEWTNGIISKIEAENIKYEYTEF